MSYIKSYISHIRKQNKEVKNLHSVLLASICTGFFIVVYLFFVRGIKPPTPKIEMSGERVYSSQGNHNLPQDLYDKNKTLSDSSIQPFQEIRGIFQKAAASIQELKINISETQYKAN